MRYTSLVSRNKERSWKHMSALANVYRMSFQDESLRVRRAATYLLVKGLLTVVREEEARAFEDAGCETSLEHDDRDGWVYRVTCEGAKLCYTNEDFYGKGEK